METKATGREISRPPREFAVSALFVCALVASGFVLQLTFGSFDFRLLAAPVNLFWGGAMVLLCAASAPLRRTGFVRWFTGVPMSVCLIVALLSLALIMGLTPQGAMPAGGVAKVSARLGFSAMTSSWPFVLVYSAVLLSLGSLVARRLAQFRLRDRAFYLNHTGLWLALFASGLGHADTERYVVSIDEGSVEWRGYDKSGHPRELPVAVRLHDFDMEEYPPQSAASRPEPKRFTSDVEILTPDGRSKRGLTEVNHPLRFGGWMVYQYGYDREAGPASHYSVVELVRDPWLAPVYIGFIMMAIGALAMIWKGRKDGLE